MEEGVKNCTITIEYDFLKSFRQNLKAKLYQDEMQI